MTIEKLERTIWRLRKNLKKNEKYIKWQELRKSIMHEIGTDDRTFKNNKKALIKLGWIKTVSKQRFILTNKELE